MGTQMGRGSVTPEILRLTEYATASPLRPVPSPNVERTTNTHPLALPINTLKDFLQYPKKK